MKRMEWQCGVGVSFSYLSLREVITKVSGFTKFLGCSVNPTWNQIVQDHFSVTHPS